ncbi:secreted RxLR effector protein 161-like [Coffea arabica]|uniref:Secreted RxLR effector protein 161-like n=1 Tax=Coffea arabica TaxID=13443 RepID=A0ABM4WMM7_COFAR
MYATATRPDIMYSVSQVSRFMDNPKELHFQAVKRIIRYLKETSEYGLFYQRNRGRELVGYTNSDYASDVEDRKSTSGYVFMLSEAAILWISKKRPVVSLSTTEVEFIAAAESSCQAVWLRRILETVGRNQINPTAIYCDNSSTIKLSRNPVLHGRSKHIDIRFHFLRELTRNGMVELLHCSPQEQVADVMTKPLKLEDFIRMRDRMGVVTNVN